MITHTTNHNIRATGTGRLAISFDADLEFKLYGHTVEVYGFTVALEYGDTTACVVEAGYNCTGHNALYWDDIPDNLLVLAAMRRVLRTAGFEEAAIQAVCPAKEQLDGIALYNADSLIDQFEALVNEQYGDH